MSPFDTQKPMYRANLVIAASSPTPQRAPFAMSVLPASWQKTWEHTTARFAAPEHTAIWKTEVHIALTANLDPYHLTEVHRAVTAAKESLKRI